MTNRILLKIRAKFLIFTTKPSPLIAGTILTVISFLIFLFQSTGNGEAVSQLLQNGTPYTVADLAKAMYTDMMSNIPALVLTLCFRLLTSYISFGMLCYAYKLSDGQTPTAMQDLFPPILTFLKSFVITLIVGILSTIGLLLFIVPGIVVIVWYSQARFIMLAHPEKSIIACLTESRKLMRGRIFEYLMLSLSFAGWYILTSFTVVSGVWAYPYINITMALYYRTITQPEFGETLKFPS